MATTIIFAVMLVTFLFIITQCREVFDTSKFDFLNQTAKQYCINNALSQREIEYNKQLFQERISKMSQWLPDYSAHLIDAIVKLCNRRNEQFMNIIHNDVKYTVRFSIPFILGIFAISFLFIVWVYVTFWKQNKQKKDENANNHQFTNKTQVALAIFIISLLVAISISSYGFSKTDQIEKSLNTFWCTLLKQHHGYVRNQTGQKSRMIDYARQLGQVIQFITNKSTKIGKLFKQIENSSLISTKSNNISQIVPNFTESFIYYKDTLQFERQVMVGSTFVIGNLDRYGNKYIGYDNISKIFSQGVSFILLSVIIICLFSGAMVAYILLQQKIMYFKNILQYLLGLVCFICLISALFNSLISIVFINLHFCRAYTKIGQNPRQQFFRSKTLNDPLVQIMVSFWPQSPGNITLYGKGAFLNTLYQLQNKLQQSKSQAQQQFTSYSNILMQMHSQITSLRESMISPDELGRLDPTAFGRYIYSFVQSLYVHNFNRAYEYRLIFGYTSLFLMLAVISSIFIDISKKTYLKANSEDSEENSQFFDVEKTVQKNSLQITTQ